ncbi:MAG: hypothetical protein LC437_09035, partial [Thiohalomonas sp.]|nr:hypothetical protein [Thiohalomonas sp.]
MKMLDFHREEDQNYPMTQITLRAHEKSALEMQHKHSRNGKERDIPNQLENAGSNTWKLSLIRESNDFPMLGK